MNNGGEGSGGQAIETRRASDQTDDPSPSLVIYRDSSGRERIHPTTTLAEAISVAERLYNDASINGARVFRLREVEIDLGDEPSTEIDVTTEQSPVA